VRWESIPADLNVRIPTLEDALIGLLDREMIGAGR
jgi:hypothetical protein